MVFIEILDEDGLQRKIRVSFFKKLPKSEKKATDMHWVKTPILVLPLSDFLLSNNDYIHLIEQDQNIIINTFSDQTEFPPITSNYNRIISFNSGYYTKEGNRNDFLDSFTASRNPIRNSSQNSIQNPLQNPLKNSLYEEGSGLIPLIMQNVPSTFIDEQFNLDALQIYLNEIKDQIITPNFGLSAVESFGISVNLTHLESYTELFTILTEFVKSSEIKKRLILINFKGLFNNLLNFKEIIPAILRFKSEIPADILLMASGRILPTEYALLSYIGFDLIDGSYLLLSGFTDLYYNGDTTKWIRKLTTLDEIQCSCPMCIKISEFLKKRIDYESGTVNLGVDDHDVNPLETSDKTQLVDNLNSWVALHNVQLGLNELKKIRSRLADGTLRNYVEKRGVDSTGITSCIRYLDSFQPQFIIDRTTLVKASPLLCSSPLSYTDPQILKFQKLVIENCEPRPCKICVLLPCSMGKPYSKSKSHLRFIKEIRNAAKGEYRNISQVIVTSPLGIVPRELEAVYPAAHYDISVTGVWDAEEIQTTAQCIVNWIKKLPLSIPIIAHLSGGYLSSFKIAQKILNDARRYIIVEDLNSLASTIRNELHSAQPDDKDQKSNKISSSSSDDQVQEDRDESDNKIGDELSMEEQWFKMIADFQFGKGAGQLLIGSSLRFLQSKDERYMDIYGFESYGRIDIGRFIRDSGHIRLNFAGAERIKDLPNNRLVLNIDDLQGTTVFKPAVESVSQNLCANDEVLIYTHSGKFIGIGMMIINAKSVDNLRRGAVAKIRRKINLSK